MEKPLFRSLSGSTNCLNSIDIFQYARPGRGIYRLVDKKVKILAQQTQKNNFVQLCTLVAVRFCHSRFFVCF